MKQSELDALLEFWQPALRLSDWDIEARVKTRRALGGDDGECQPYPDLAEAEIGIVKGKPSSAAADHETILVHELLHCHLERIRTDENEKDVECIIEKLSKAFVRLRREVP